ncbi:AAA family ATPase [Dietzia cercidiphylli]|uniref:AAA family ATPase n=1 Tax=Dietzia cercidiphylli TaxID=498199 RepID=UPI00223AB455|nr:helicase RepA family protein [Dietzia cercidiphylli]MCT1516586.1 helicase RepA family protein [Dietzia cercidiphylli]
MPRLTAEMAQRVSTAEPMRVPGLPHSAPEPTRSPLPRVVDLADLLQMVPAEPLLGDLLYRDSLAQLAAPAGTFKSFVAVGMACAIAAGRSWGPHMVQRRERVLYVAAEGGSGVGLRAAAWAHHYGLDATELFTWFKAVAEPIQLGDEAHVRHVIEVVREFRPALLVLDTRARVTVGMEENSATDQGVAIENAERIRRAAGSTVLVVHHTGKSGDQRGSTAWPGAVWTDISLTRTGLELDAAGKPLGATLTVTKHKDAEIPPPYSFDLESASIPQAWMPNVSKPAQLATLVAVPAQQVHTSVETKASREERKGETGDAIQAWLMAQHAETGKVPGRGLTRDWMKAQGLSLSGDSLTALIAEVRREVQA